MKRILDWDKYIEKAVEVVSEGIVMLKNDNNALPLKKDEEIATFGRTMLHYYKSGTGSGGLVNVTKVSGILDGLKEYGVNFNAEIVNAYTQWEKENPLIKPEGWGSEPWSQPEMPLDDALVEKISKTCKTALVAIGRTAGEEQDNKLEEGSYLLSALEKEMLAKVRKHFEKVVVLLNVGNIIDMEYFEEIKPDSILYIWQGGMTGGLGVAKVLTGETSPCGKLPDTIAKSTSDIASDENFGDQNRNFYCEDIYVGYRYFETFAKDKVRFPFGFGLSYTDFEISTTQTSFDGENVKIFVKVKNVGNYKGKEVVQIYCEAPQGKLGKPLRQLCEFEKTTELSPSEIDLIEFTIPMSSLSSFDDSGVTGNKNCFVLESGEYKFYVGNSVRSADLAYSVEIPQLVVTEKCTSALAPVLKFKRIKPEFNGEKYTIIKEEVPTSEIDEEKRRIDNLPKEIPYTGDKGIKLCDVRDNKASLEDFVAQMSDYDLACIIRGEGMGSPKVTPGTASAFGGVTDALADLGIPCGCCSDGPSGMRLDCGTKAFSLPNGTLIASTFNKSLITEMFTFMGLEMTANNVDCLLGPGMNIHRHPLNGRNFEYFSEDPFLTGKIATAELTGLHSVGVEGTIKHFCGNNQETNRHFLDGVVSERALREIYLRGFEIAVKEGHAKSIMTTYCPLNGVWTAGNFDLNTEILRECWGFDGFTMTDWWANINVRGNEPNHSDLAAMARAQNDVYMCCAESGKNNDNVLESLENGTLTRGELQRNAMNICRFLLNTNALKRLCGEEYGVEIINRPADEMPSDEPVVFYDIDRELTLDLSEISTEKGTSFTFALVNQTFGEFKVSITASSTSSELAQIPVSIFIMGTLAGTFTFNGSNGQDVTFETKTPVFSRYTVVRLYFAQSGLNMKNVKFELTKENPLV